jgi:hypothetical protein
VDEEEEEEGEGEEEEEAGRDAVRKVVAELLAVVALLAEVEVPPMGSTDSMLLMTSVLVVEDGVAEDGEGML